MFKPSSTYNKNKIRFLLTCLLMISLSLILFNPNARAVEIKDNITFDTIWSAELSPYIITKNISIASEVTLKIEAGAIIKFKEASGGSSGYHLKVNGTLDARGNDTDPIIFTSEENGHYWGHIEFTQESTPWDEGSSSGCILNHCIIEYAGNGEAGDYGQTSVRTISASPLIKSNIIRYSYTDGIIAFSGIQNIADNRIHDTVCAIKLLSSEGGVVENNYLIRNEQGIYVESGANTLEIRKNTVRNSSLEVFGGCLGVNLLYQDNLFSYLWEQIQGPDVDLTDPNGRPYSNDIRPTFTAPDVSNDESITFQLTVTDHGGLLSVDTVTVTVKGENKAPVADAGTDQTASEGSQVVLEGANSLDPDGGIESLSYKWEQTSGQNVILSNPNSVHCTFTAPTVGQYGETLIFQLMVTDSGGLQSKDTVNIHVTKEEVNEPPVAVASANPNQPITEGSPVTLNGSGSSDPENQIISWLWWQIEGSRVTISNPNAELASFTAPEVEWEGQSLVFELTVTDDAFQESKDRVVINVVNTDPNDRNSPPSADAGLDKEVDEGSDGSLNGTASDPDGASDIDTYQWAQISGPSVSLTGTGANRTFKAPNVTKDEELIFSLTVTDEQEMKSSDTIKVTVKWVNRPPVADADSDPETIEEGLRVLLDGSGSADEDDGIASYFWEQLTGTNVVLSGNDIVKPVFKAPDVSADEMLTFQLTVTDVSGESDSDFVIIYVVAENEAPVADAGLDQVVTEGAAVTLDGSDSYDPEDPNNGIISYLWEQSAGTIVTLYNATTPTPDFNAPQIEEDGNTPDFSTLTFLLTVRDKEDLESSDSVIVNIVQDTNNNQLPTADAGPDQTVSRGATVALDGSKSFDPDDPCEIWVSDNHFIQDDSEDSGNAIAIAKNTSANCTFNITSNNIEKLNGNFLVYLYNWLDANSQPVDMTQNWWGTTSATNITSMIYDQDQDAHVPQVNYGSRKNKAIAGAGSDLSYPPMADAGKRQDEEEEVETVAPDDKVILDGSNTYDPDDIMSYEWTQIEGQTVTITNAGSVSASFIAPTPEEDEEEGETVNTLTFRLKVTDPLGFYDTDEITIEIKESDEKAFLEESSGCFIAAIMSDVRSY